MDISINKAKWSSLALGALALGFGASCSQDKVSNSNDESVGGTYQELATQLENCNSNALDCLKAANCDTTQQQACKSAFEQCHAQTKAALQAFHKAVEACFTDERQCVAASRDAAPAPAVNGGTSARQVCRDQFASCVKEDRPIPPAPGPCMQGLHDCVKAGQTDAMTCFQQAGTCFINRLPPRCERAHAGSGATGQAGSSSSAGSGAAGN